MHKSLSIHISIHPRLDADKGCWGIAPVPNPLNWSASTSGTSQLQKTSHRPSQKAAYSDNIHVPHFLYIHNKFSVNRCSGCLLRDSQPADPQSTYIKWPMHPLCAAAHTREYVLSTPAKPRKNMSILLQTENVPVEWEKPCVDVDHVLIDSTSRL